MATNFNDTALSVESAQSDKEVTFRVWFSQSGRDWICFRMIEGTQAAPNRKVGSINLKPADALELGYALISAALDKQEADLD